MPENTLLNCQPLSELLHDLLELKQRIITGTERERQKLSLESTHQESLDSLLNVLNYVVMRREALHDLQTRLAKAGLSSLGRVEPHVMTNIDAVLDVLSKAVSCKDYERSGTAQCVDYDGGYRVLKQRAQRLFGPPNKKRSEYIMVTMPSDAATDINLVERLMAAGMDAARINCAHDNETVWAQMIANLRQVAQQQNTECRILMDLAGHKIRTGNIYISGKKGPKKVDSTQKSPRLHDQDWLILCKESDHPKHLFEEFDVPVGVAVTCTYPDVIDLVEVGQTLWIDDGKIGSVIKQKSEQALLLQVNQVGPKGVRLKPEKGLNFPETVLNLPTLSEKDLHDLQFVSQHADLIGLSFTESPQDLLNLKEQLSLLGQPDRPILAKIETADAVRQLPQIIVQALAQNMEIGIMIARGDLAVELGSVRMAEIQDEMLRLCEAAHVPVVWATQVLESLAKVGTISRPEISDAAMSQRAECVMLNKGPYITTAVQILSDVLQRMEAHQFKSHTHMRALHW